MAHRKVNKMAATISSASTRLYILTVKRKYNKRWINNRQIACHKWRLLSVTYAIDLWPWRHQRQQPWDTPSAVTSLHGIQACRLYHEVMLTHKHRRQRLRWIRIVQRRQQRDWCLVLFGEESRFQLFRADGRVRVNRRNGERTARACVLESEPLEGGAVMVSCGICG